jgi:broad specificity phosphatase PhoE
MSYRQIAETMPDEYAARAADKLRYRYPRGESYEDVVQRLDPLIAELERHTEPLLIVGHQAVLRVLYAYVIGEPRDNCPFLSIPLHTVIELVPTAYGCDERRFELDV